MYQQKRISYKMLGTLSNQSKTKLKAIQLREKSRQSSEPIDGSIEKYQFQ